MREKIKLHKHLQKHEMGEDLHRCLLTALYLRKPTLRARLRLNRTERTHQSGDTAKTIKAVSSVMKNIIVKRGKMPLHQMQNTAVNNKQYKA